MRDKTLRAAIVGTGAAGLIAKPDPANTFFIWIHALDMSSAATVASWHELFTLLSQPPS